MGWHGLSPIIDLTLQCLEQLIDLAMSWLSGCSFIRLGCVNLEHLLFNIVHLLLNVIETIFVVVGLAAILASWSDNRLGGLPALEPVDLAENVGAENLHLASLGCHAHVRARLVGLVARGCAAMRCIHLLRTVLFRAVHN